MKSTTLLILLFGFFVAFTAAAPKGGRGGGSRGGGSRGGHDHDHVETWPPTPGQRECDAFNHTCVEVSVPQSTCLGVC